MAEQQSILKTVPKKGRALLSEAPSSARLADPIVKDPDKETLLGEYGLTGGLIALGGILSKSKFAPRLAQKGLLAMGRHFTRRTGSKIGYSLLGGAAGAALLTPTSYLGAKASEMSEKDKEFNPGHFAAIAAPAAVSGTLGYGAYANVNQSIKRADKTGAKGMIKNILSPRRNIRYTKHGLNLAGKAFRKIDTSGAPKVKPGFNLSRLKRAKGIAGKQWKGRAGGLLALGLLGMEALSPAMYLNQTLNKKKDGKDGRA